MEEIAANVGQFFLGLALALSLVALGVMTFVTVLAGLAMAFAHGKVMEIAKDWFWRIAGCVIFTGSASLLIKGIQAKLAGG